MGAEIIALVSSVLWAGDTILIRQGARYTGVAVAALMSFFLSMVVLWAIIAYWFDFSLLRSDAILYFGVSGLIQPAIVRFLHYTGIVHLGASRAGPVRSIGPLFAITIAFVFLGERAGATVYLGAVLCVVGVWLISNRREGEKEWKIIHLGYPIAAALLTAVSQNFRKAGLLILPNPFIATAIAVTTSFVVFSLGLLITGQLRTLRPDRRSLPFYGSAALVSSTAQLLGFVALSQGELSVVVPLINTNPLFIILFSAIFLKDLERITVWVVAGAALIVAGIGFITVQ